MISGAIDKNSYKQGKITWDGKATVVATHRVHIFPQSVGKGVENSGQARFLGHADRVHCC